MAAVFLAWLRKQMKPHSPKSRFGGKPACIRSHWKGMSAFLKDGRMESGIHKAGNLIRPVAAARTNSLFTRHDNGARARDRIA